MGCRKLDISPLEKALLQLVYSAGSWSEKTGASYSYFGARYYDPNISIWLSVDPLSDKAPGLTPYRYAMNNPICLIDPNGMLEDGYTVNDNGDRTWVNNEGGEKYDVLYNEDEYNKGNKNYDTGNKNDGISIAKEVLKSEKHPKVNEGTEANPKIETLTVFDNVKGDSEARELFEWLEENTSVEWGVTRIGALSGNSGKNLLTTLGNKEGEGGRSYALRKGYTIRSHAHGHPTDIGKWWASSMDNDNHNEMTLKFKRAKSFIYYDGMYREYDGFRTTSTPSSF